MIDGLIHISDLFGREHLVKNDKPLSERATLIDYFANEIKRPVKLIAIRLAHYTLSDLYALKSCYADRLRRDGRETADKWFWWTTKTTVSAALQMHTAAPARSKSRAL